MISPLLLVVFLVTTLIIAAAAPLNAGFSGSAITRRAPIPYFLSCPAVNRETNRAWAHSYDSQSIMNAANSLAAFMNLNDAQKPRWRNKFYPHHFRTDVPQLSPAVLAQLRGISDCAPNQSGKTFLEFPMANFAGNGPYTGGDPGLDRVIVLVNGTYPGPYRGPVYCLSTANEPYPSQHFRPCT